MMVTDHALSALIGPHLHVGILGLVEGQQVCLHGHERSRARRRTGNLSFDNWGWKVEPGSQIRWFDRQHRRMGGLPQPHRGWRTRRDERHQRGSDLFDKVEQVV
jgi:hypothetical protein